MITREVECVPSAAVAAGGSAHGLSAKGGVYPGQSGVFAQGFGVSAQGEGVSSQGVSAFVEGGVYPSMHWAGGCLPQCMLGCTPPPSGQNS